MISHIGDGGAIGGADHIVSSQAGDNTVTGTAEANTTVTIKSGATTLDTATTDGSGNWSYALTAANVATIGQGSGKTVTATATDGVGNVSAGTTSFNFAVDTIAPNAPVISHIGDGGAIGGADHIISSQTGDNTVTGTAEANSTVTIKSGATTLGTATTDGSGNGSYTLTAANIATIGQGSGKTISATGTDVAGNTSGSTTSFSFTEDTSAPTVSNVSFTKAGNDRTVTVTLSEAVVGFDASDVQVSSGTVSSVSGAGTSWTVAVSNVSGNPINFQILQSGTGTSSWSDVAGNGGTASSVTDIKPAGIAGEPINLGLTDPAGNHAGPVTLTITGVPSDCSIRSARSRS